MMRQAAGDCSNHLDGIDGGRAFEAPPIMPCRFLRMEFRN
jgi:hypothetical protein